MAGHVVMQRAALAQRHLDQFALGRSVALRMAFRAPRAPSVAEADAALLVADHDQRGEAEPPAALTTLATRLILHSFIDEFLSRFPRLVRAAGLGPLCDPSSRSSRSSSLLAGASAERLDAAMIEIAAAVEHASLDCRP